MSFSLNIEIDKSQWDKYRERVEENLLMFNYVLDNILKDELENAVEVAKMLVPIDTGRLHASIRREENALVADARNPNTGQGYAGYVEYGCLTSFSNYILTYNGWKSWADIKVGDKVYTHKLRWKKVTNKYEKKLSNDPVTVTIKTNKSQITVTDNHPIRMLQGNWIPAGNIKVRDQIICIFNERLCPVCGNSLKPNQKFCSPKCQHTWRRGKTWEEIYGKEKAKQIRKKRKTGKVITCKHCGISFYASSHELRYGRKFCSLQCYGKWRKDKTYEQIYGFEQAEKIQEKRKGKTYEEFYGIEKARKIKEKLSETLRNLPMKARQNMSKGQYRRWASQSGILERQKRSQRMKGKNNPNYGGKYSYGYSSGRGALRKDLGHYVRSSWEANICRVLKALNITYEYEPKAFVLSNGHTYTPDLLVHIDDFFVEIKGFWQENDLEKMALFLKEYPKIKLQIIDEKIYLQIEEYWKEKILNWEPEYFKSFNQIKLHTEVCDVIQIRKNKVGRTNHLYDLIVEDDHSYVANNFLVHNTSRQVAQPYIRPALDYAVANINQRVIEEVRGLVAVREVWRGIGAVEVIREAGRFVTWRRV